MKRAIAVTLAAVLLTGCVATNRVKPGEAAKAPPSRSVVIVGLDRAKMAAMFFTIDVRGIDAATGEIVTAPLDPDKPRRATVIATVESFADEPRFQAFVLEPGSYAIAAIQAGAGAPARNYSPNFGLPATRGAGWIGFGVSAMTSLAAASAGQLPPADTLYVDDVRLRDTAPRFELKPGEVVYIGDLLFGTEFRILESTHLAGRATGGGAREAERSHNHRYFVEYGQDPDGARAFARQVGLADRPLRVVTLRLFEEDKPYAFLGRYPPLDRLHGTVVEGPTIHRAPRIAAAGG